MAKYVGGQIVLIFASIVCQTSATGTILHHPKSRLVPIGVEVTFTCIIRGGANPHWMIDERSLAYQGAVRRITEEGYIIERQDKADDVTSLSLTFNVTKDKNGTMISCSSLYTRSNKAVLLSISESPLMQNPFIMKPNASSILLKWSPPFLWPGRSIHHYNVSIDRPSRKMMFYYVNATFSDAVVTFLKVSDNPTEIWRCYEIKISAIADNGTELSTFTVVGVYLPNPMNITTSDVNITVLFEPDRSPLVIVDVKLPWTICIYQHVNYSIIIEGDGKMFHHGPYQQYGSNPIRITIASGLEENKEYTLMVTVATQGLAGISYSQQYTFNTSLQFHEQADHPSDCTPRLSMHNNTVTVMTNVVESSIYKVMLGVFVGVTTILLLILIICLCALCQIRRKSTTVTAVVNSTNRVFNSMTNNPIYNGPVYDSIVQSQFDTLPTKASEASKNEPITVTSDSDQSTVIVSEIDDKSESVDPDRYVKQSCQSKSFSFSPCTNSSAPSTESGVVNVNQWSTQSASLSAPKSGDSEKSKLFLTLPTYRECKENYDNLGDNERHESKAIFQEEHQAKDDEDNMYTVMRPIGTVTGSMDDSHHAL